MATGGLSRRAFFPATAGGIMGAPEAVKAAAAQVAQMQYLPVPPATPYPYSYAGEAAQDSSIDRKPHLLERKARLERWARGDFGEEGDGFEPRGMGDPAMHAISNLRSVSQQHKLVMANDLAHRRYREGRMRGAQFELRHILKQLGLT
jgi:hypothetical protein